MGKKLGILNGPNDENFLAGIFTKIRPVWIGELEIMPKTLIN